MKTAASQEATTCPDKYRVSLTETKHQNHTIILLTSQFIHGHTYRLMGAQILTEYHLLQNYLTNPSTS